MKLIRFLSLGLGLIAATTAVNAQTDAQLFTVAQRTIQNTDFTTAAESTINGVVCIKSFATIRSQSSPFSGFMDPFEFFFPNNYTPSAASPDSNDGQIRRRGGRNDESQQREKGMGSGVIISEDGYIITNNHVVEGAERLEVLLNDNRVFNATVIGTDAATDLALIKIDCNGLSVIPWGSSDDLKIGEWVLAVGNPFGLNSTVTAGIVSAKARSISGGQQGRMGIESYIQTDAAVNPGNSGGALVNLKGELVGINSAIYSQTGSYTGYSFAIPTSIVKKVAEDLQKFRTVQRAVLGISYSELTAKIAADRGITKVTEGLIVGNVADRSAAMEAGLKEGDVIIAINGKPTHRTSELMEQINLFRPGEKITITYIRDNKEYTTQATLYNSAGNTNLSAVTSLADLGCAFKVLKDETKRQLKISYGIQVAGIKDGPFKDAGIKDGFIILEVNNRRINSVDDMEAAYNEVTSPDASENVMFITGIYPTGKKAYYAVDLEQ
ncbi:MAG: Do family serine endopeptidase [Bacteroides sp.]|nr:Do family serine endopeptidase [Bacteroides sp.]MCM1412905.1 Do family serine endopeptidase [Bacteroides sp.]MCM1471574.1 Do family serine endopeptidase [Bacteroides sp.]